MRSLYIKLILFFSVAISIGAILRNNWWETNTFDEKNEFSRYNRQVKNLLKALCIKSEEISVTLPEEKKWLIMKGVDATIQKSNLHCEPEHAIGEKEHTPDEIAKSEIPDSNDDEYDYYDFY